MDDPTVVVKGDVNDALNKLGVLKGALGGTGNFAAGALKAGALGALGLGAGIAAAAIPVTKIGIDFNAMKEKAMTSFNVLTGSTEKANALFKDLNKFSAETPYQFEEISKAATSLLAANVAPETIVGTLRRIGDVAAGLNIPFADLSDIYGKIRTQGRVFGEDINQLQGRGIPIIQELAKQFGVNESEIKKMVEEGKIGAPEIEKAFKSMTEEGGKFSGMMSAQSKTFNGMLSTLQDNFNQIAGELTEPIFDVLKESLGGVLAMMDTPEFKQGTKDFASGIATHLKGAIEWVKGNFPVVQQVIGDVIAFLQPILGTLISLLGSLLQGGQQAAGGFAQAFPQIQNAVGAVWSFIKPILDAIFGELGKFWTEIQPKLAAAWANIEKVTREVAGAIAQFIAEHWTEIQNIFQGAWNIIQGIVQVAWSAISGIVKIALDLIAGDFDAAGKDFKTMMEGIWGGIQKIIEGAWQEIQGYVALALNTVGKVIAEKMNSAVEDLKTILRGAVEWLQTLPEQFAEVADSMINGLIEGMKLRAADVANTLGDIINAAVSAAKAALGISSPSKVFRGMGENMALGLQQGFGMPQLQFSAMGVGSSATLTGRGFGNGESFGASPVTSTSNQSVTNNVYITASVRSDADINALADRVSERLGVKASHRITPGFVR